MTNPFTNPLGFQNKLSYDEIGEKDGRVVIRLTKPLIYIDKTGRRHEVPVGFECDMSSVPRLPVIFFLWGDKAHREGVLHDYHYRKNSVFNLSRQESDGLFAEAIKSNSPSHPAGSCLISGPMWSGVRLGGWTAFHVMSVNDHYKLDIEYKDAEQEVCR